MKSTNRLYGNCVVLNGDVPMFRCDEERMNWYLQMDLGEMVTVNPPVMRLKFKPKGPGHAGDPYFIQQFKNRCVVCGIEEGLSHHHIVPYCYRRFFPKDSYEYGRWFYDVLLLCVECHHAYEDRAHELKQTIAHEHGVPAGGTTSLTSDEILVLRSAGPLIKHQDKIPPDKRRRFEEVMKGYLGKDDFTLEDLEKAVNVIKDGIVTTPAAEIIIAQVKDLDAFATRWRKHFLRHMNPRFMPDLWDPERRIYSEPDNGKGKS